ncbi:MAG: hypothetical protein KC621_05045 [Myxococcales bacterium]|nr:hypothetical protein [Myxococcales bacterium]
MSNRADRDWQEPNEVHLTRIDVPFLDLTWFFVKASMALGVAFLVTSWLWVVIGTGVVALSSGLLLLLGVPGWFMSMEQPMAAASAPPSIEPAPVLLIAPAPAIEPPPPPEPEPEPVPVQNEDANRAATEAAQRAEIERMRREREQNR